MSRLLYAVIAIAIVNLSMQAQAPAPVSTLTAEGLLVQSLLASGMTANAVQDVTATGTMTYFWGGQPVAATATFRVRGADQFRIDSNVPGGTRSVAFNHNVAARKDPNGTVTGIPLHNALSMAETSFPYLAIANLLTDPSFSISDIGLVTSGTQTLHQIRVRKVVSPTQDPRGMVRKLSQTDYFIDPQTNLIAKIADVTHPVETFTREYAREVELQSYSTFRGVAVPTLVREKISGMTMWEFRVSGVTFNSGLTDTDFTVQ